MRSGLFDASCGSKSRGNRCKEHGAWRHNGAIEARLEICHSLILHEHTANARVRICVCNAATAQSLALTMTGVTPTFLTKTRHLLG